MNNLRSDSISSVRDTTVVDSLNIKPDSAKVSNKTLEQRLGIRISKDALSEVVVATARDSAVMNLDSNLFYLYGKAKVTYEDNILEAGQVTYNQANNNVTASPQFDTAGKAIEKPIFTQGSEKILYDSLQYNFKSKRAIVRNANSQYGEGFLRSEQVKRNPDQSIYGLHNVYTTCSLDEPHFGIVAKKIKVIPNRIAASGPANIAIEGVPTPLFLPFGLFPISQKQRSGFILPTYTVEQNRGIGLLNGGYYFAISDKLDLLTQVNIFSKGSWQASGSTNYKSIYHYSGEFQFQYAYNKTGESYEPTSKVGKEFIVNWAHRTDPKAKPGQSFNASLRVGTSSFYSSTSYDPLQAVDNRFLSNLSYSKSWQNKPYNLTISALHNQNTLDGSVNVTLPSIAFSVASISPFQNKNYVGKPRWFDNISFPYTLSIQNKTSFYDSLFDINNLDFDNGVTQNITVGASYNVLRFFKTGFSIPYNEYWYTKEIIQQYNPATDKMDSTVTRGFYTARDFSFNVPFSTQIFGTKLFKKGKIRGIRHRLEPSVNFSYRPDFSKSNFNYYYRARTDSNAYDNLYRFQGSEFVGTIGKGEQRNIGFGINNNLQMKVRSKKDTVSGFKNITLIDRFGISSGYNFAADSLNWAPISVNFATNIVDKILLNATASFDQYGINKSTDRQYTQSTMWQRGDGFARFTGANISASTSLTSKPKKKDDKTGVVDRNNGIVFNPDYYNYIDFDIPWSINLSYALTLSNNYLATSKKDTLQVSSHNLTAGGEFNVTPRWKVSVQTSYNFIDKKLQYTSVKIFRDLHCWAMRLEMVPFGPNKNYNFTLNVKAAVLQDLKLTRRRDFRDAVQ